MSFGIIQCIIKIPSHICVCFPRTSTHWKVFPLFLLLLLLPPALGAGLGPGGLLAVQLAHGGHVVSAEGHKGVPA